MNLRARIALSLLVICLILVAPAVYSLSRLSLLSDIAENLQTRDAAALLELGRLQSSLQELAQWQRTYAALAGDSQAAQSVAENVARFDGGLDALARAGYADATVATRAEWDRLQRAIREEQRLVQAEEFAQAQELREQELEPAFSAVDRSLDAIGLQINRAGQEQTARAADVATDAASRTLLALFLALLASLIVAAVLTRALLRPITELRRGMSVVAAGDLEPELRIPLHRQDEVGDLARSFDRMTQQLAELDRMKAEFVSVASHELKTPLSVIKGYVSLLHEGIYGPISDEQRKVLGSVAEQSDRLARLIQQLLDVSRFEAGGGRLDLRAIDFRSFLQELATSFEALAIQNQIDFRLETDEPLPATIVADPDRLNEVVGNLLSNAFKFTPRQGRIRLRAAGVDGGVQIEVEDTGVGIPSAQLPRIFEKFFQVENALQPRSIGSGLGLAISKEIVEAHGGTITATSEEGHGTTFSVLLPDATAPAERLPLATESR